MKKIIIFIMLLSSMFGCNGANNKPIEMFLYEEKGLGKVLSPVELTEKKVVHEDWSIGFFNEDETVKLLMYIISAKSDYLLEVEDTRQFVKKEGTEGKYEEDEFDVYGYHFMYFRSYDVIEDIARIYLIFENNQGGIQMIFFMSGLKDSDVFIKEFKTSFELEEIDMAPLEEHERYNVIPIIMEQVGNDMHGYIDIPIAWIIQQAESATDYTLFMDISGFRGIILSSADIEIFNGDSIEQVLEIIKASYQRDGVIAFDIKSKEVNGYIIYYYLSYIPELDKGMITIAFDRNDGKRECITIEGEIWILPYLEELVLNSFSETK